MEDIAEQPTDETLGSIVDIDPENSSLDVPPPTEASSASRGDGIRVSLAVTVIFGMVMFLLGGTGGYLSHPLLNPATPTATLTSAQQQQEQQMQQLLAMLVQRTRHFEGSANAPVTIIEFGDFQ